MEVTAQSDVDSACLRDEHHASCDRLLNNAPGAAFNGKTNLLKAPIGQICVSVGYMTSGIQQVCRLYSTTVWMKNDTHQHCGQLFSDKTNIALILSEQDCTNLITNANITIILKDIVDTVNSFAQ